MTTKQTRRRGNGEGSIYQRSGGRWCATISLAYSTNGRRKRQTVYGKTKREAQEKLARLQSLKLDGMLCEPSKLTVSAFLDHWLEDAARPTIRQTTYASYGGIIRNHLKPRIGKIVLSKLTPAHVQGLYSAMERNGASPRLRQLVPATLRRALKQAVRWNMIPRNVCDAVDPPRIERKDITPLTAEQAGLLLRAAEGDRIQALYVLAVTTGMRLGELLGLQWSNTNLKKGTLSVCHTLVEVDGILTLSEPKTAKSRRSIDLPKMAVDALWEHKRIQLAEGHGASSFVFCNTQGTPLRRSHLHRRSFKPLLELAGLPRIRFHDLRHTAATLMLTEGIHAKVVQERLGHSQISVTLDIYPTMQKDAAATIDRLFRATGA